MLQTKSLDFSGLQCNSDASRVGSQGAGRPSFGCEKGNQHNGIHVKKQQSSKSFDILFRDVISGEKGPHNLQVPGQDRVVPCSTVTPHEREEPARAGQ